MFFAVTVFTQLQRYGAAVEAGDTLLLGASLTGNQTIISKNGTFELGFFSPTGSNWYIGIWYAQIPEKTYVWVANRATPARNRSGVLKLSREGNLVLFDAHGASIWSVNTTNKASTAVLLDSGNFLMLSEDNESETVWQSFDNPVDTWLPGMVFGGQQKLVSWKNSLDPAPGLFSLHTDPSGAKQLVLTWDNSLQYWETGTWDGKTYTGVPEMSDKRRVNITFNSNSSGFFESYTLVPPFNALIRLTLTKFGQVRVYVFDGSKWSMFWSVPRDGCDVYGTCGAYGTCDSRNLQLCSCGEGFKPRDNSAWLSQDWASSGCVRKSLLRCDAINGSTDRFIDLGVTLPDDFASSYPASTKKDCENGCLRNCSCTTFSFNPPSGPCQIWSGDLLNIRNSTASKSNSNVFIRVDVYSFGMTLLEIISGQRNVNLNVQASSNFYFPSWAATQVQQGSTMNIVEEGVAAEANMEEVRRACVVALLCIQEDEEVRPSMGQVVQMLEGKIEPQTPQISSSTFRPEHPSDESSYSQGNVTSKKNVNGSMHSKIQRHVI
ncbi:hypothetical protein SUGI_0257700 [Cryptomeria japonica]|nr:hypothetical protein SUGI_0257700 [Cryptomeria japonica]